MTQRCSRSTASRHRLERLVLIIAVLAMATPPPSLAAQEEQGSPPPMDSFEAPQLEPSLDLRIRAARQSHERNRLVGNTGVSLGAMAVAGALLDWAMGGQLGMGSPATGALLGGLSFVAGGVWRFHIGERALQQADTWEAEATPANPRDP